MNVFILGSRKHQCEEKIFNKTSNPPDTLLKIPVIKIISKGRALEQGSLSSQAPSLIIKHLCVTLQRLEDIAKHLTTNVHNCPALPIQFVRSQNRERVLQLTAARIS